MSTRDVLLEILELRGELSPAVVLEEASNVDHPLHDRFVWDDTAAAHRFRLLQAQSIIRSVRVVVDSAPNSAPVEVRAFVAEAEIGEKRDDYEAVDAEAYGTGRYRTVESVIASDVTRTAWFRSLERDWQALRRRAGASQEFANLVLEDVRRMVG